MAYKSGKELEKDGNRVSLFFHLATPKVDHFMAHELTLEAPPGVAAAHVYAHVVSEQGAPLRSISLLFYDHDSDRFVPCSSDNTNQPAFVMENGDTVEVRFRIDTPSKKNMDEPYCVAYEVRSHDSPGGNPQQLPPPTQRQGSTVLVRSQLTPPVYVQTKRGGTTAVPSTKAPSSPPRSSVAESEVPVVAMAAARAAAAASARALGGTSAGNNAPMVNVGGGSSSSSRLDDDSSSSSSGRSTRGANRQRTEKALSYDLAVGSRGGGSVVKAEVSRSNGTRKRVDGDSGNINGRKRGRVSSQSFGDGGGNFDGGGEEPRIAALESAVDLLLSSLSEVHGKVDRLTDMMLATTRHCLLTPASSEHHAGPGTKAAAPNEASTEAAALLRSSYQSDHAASLAQLRSTLEAVTSAATTLVDSPERFRSSGGGGGGGALTSPSSLSAVGLLESLADTALAERRAARGREMQRDMEDEGEEAVGGGSSGEDAGSAKAEHATDDRKDNNSLLRYSSLGPVRLDRDLRPDDVHAALGSLASHASLPHQHRPLRQSSLLGPPPTPQAASNEVAAATAAAAVHPAGAESSSSGSSSCTLDDAVLLATAAMGPRKDDSGGSSSSSSSILNSDGDGADGMPLETADVVSASQEDDSLQFSQLSQDSAIRPSGCSQEGAPVVPLSDSDKSDQGDRAPGVEAPGVGTPV